MTCFLSVSAFFTIKSKIVIRQSALQLHINNTWGGLHVRRINLRHMTSVAGVLSVIILSGLLSGCKSEHSGEELKSTTSAAQSLTEQQAAQLARHQQEALEVFQQKCASCHNAATTNSRLKDIMDVNYLTSSPLGFIRRGVPSTSSIYLVIVDGDVVTDSVARHRLQAKIEIDYDKVTAIRDWISELGGLFNLSQGPQGGR